MPQTHRLSSAEIHRWQTNTTMWDRSQILQGIRETAVIGSTRWSGLQVRVSERSVNPSEGVICRADDTFPGELIDTDINHSAAIGSPLNFWKKLGAYCYLSGASSR